MKASLDGWRSVKFGMPIYQAVKLEGGFEGNGSSYDGAAAIAGETFEVRIIPADRVVDRIILMPFAMDVLTKEACFNFVEKNVPRLTSTYGDPDEVVPAATDRTETSLLPEETPKYIWKFDNGGEIRIAASRGYFNRCYASIDYSPPTNSTPSSF